MTDDASGGGEDPSACRRAWQRPPVDHALFVTTIQDQATAAAGHSVDAWAWMELFDTGFARIAGRFARVEPRRQARSYLLGLLADVETRSCWQLAEHAGDRSPHRMQRLLGEARWDADAVRDDLRGYVADELGDPQAVLVIDDTGDVKKGVHSVGVQRQYTGTAGRIENSQVGVFLGYAAGGGYTLIDREIYLPRSWTDRPDRCAGAAVPGRVRFATKISLARRMLTRALAAGIPAAWVTADEFYGGDGHLRRDLQTHRIGYVLAVAKSHRVLACTAIGPQRVDQIAASLPARSWNRRSAGDGSKGWREYDWAWVRLVALEPETDAGGHHYLLVRRNRIDGELAFYRCWAPVPVPLRTLVAVAGCRWSIETCFQTGKGSAWTSIRSAAGTPGTATRRWSCSPTPS
jgi:SRSO17 transposase